MAAGLHLGHAGESRDRESPSESAEAKAPDFLLHNVGTGDGIVQNGGQGTANKLRTPPLWGVRTRTRLMHDGSSLTARDAILRHRGEAEYVIENYHRLRQREQQNLIAFLSSL